VRVRVYVCVRVYVRACVCVCVRVCACASSVTKWDSVPILCYSGLALFCLSYLPCRFISFEKR
jgi:hypothetical protein